MRLLTKNSLWFEHGVWGKYVTILPSPDKDLALLPSASSPPWAYPWGSGTLAGWTWRSSQPCPGPQCGPWSAPHLQTAGISCRWTEERKRLI